jgi:hypothetical protein
VVYWVRIQLEINMAAPPGNKFAKGGKRTGAGRKPLKIRELCAKLFADRLDLVTAIADNPKEAARDRLAALGLLAKYGLGERFELAGDADAPLKVTLDVL